LRQPWQYLLFYSIFAAGSSTVVGDAPAEFNIGQSALNVSNHEDQAMNIEIEYCGQ
jgi:hypothetical protein